MRLLLKLTALLLLVGLLLGACSQDDRPSNTNNMTEKSIEENPTGNEDKDELVAVDAIMDQPIELNVYYPYSDSSFESFMNGYGQFIVEIYPNLTFNWLNTKTISTSELLVSNQPVDLAYGNTTMLRRFKENENIVDLHPYIKKYNFDLDKVENITIDLATDLYDHSLMGLPAYVNTHLLFYNKAIFDKFGEDYPKDEMTWDEIYEIARTMTRLDDGVQYLGFNYYFLTGGFLLINPYGESWVDPQTNQITMAEGRWPNIIRNFQRFYEIPGMEDIRGTDAVTAFGGDERIAMQITLSNRIASKNSIPEDWDIVSYPVFPDNPGIGAGVDPIYMFIPEISTQKDEAFLAIAALMDEQSQIGLLQHGRMPSIKIDNFEEILANEVEPLENRNYNAVLANNYPPALVLTEEVDATRTILGGAFTAVIRGEKDINTALREATEEAISKLKELEMQ